MGLLRNCRCAAAWDDGVGRHLPARTLLDGDKAVLEAVQAAEERGCPEPPVRLAVDTGPNRFRRILERPIRAEREEAALPGSGRAAAR